MAAVELEFAINRVTGLLSSSYLAFSSYTLPDLVAGDTLSFRIRLVKPNLTGMPGSLALIDPTGLAMKVGIGTAGALLVNFDLAVDGNAFVGDVALTDAAIAALFSGSVTRVTSQKIEFRILEGAGYKRIQKDITLVKEILTTATTATNPNEEALGKNEAKALYVPRDGGEAGQGWVMKDGNGVRYSIYMGTDEQLHWEKIV
jgi:hypothetical protein